MKKTALVVCPGRGTYNKPELGSIYANIGENNANIRNFIANIDTVRESLGCPTLTELDQAPLFKTRVHQHPDNAATLIYGAGYSDFMAIDREQYEIVAITGNSMGWYTAMACAQSWDSDTAIRIVTDMAQRTAGGAGAQFIYPLVDADWRPHPDYIGAVQAQIKQHGGDLQMSIQYGGYAVLAGTEAACQAAMAALPPVDERFPLLLHGHAAFHTQLMAEASQQALQHWPEVLFKAPEIPLVDGRGKIWPTSASDAAALKHYTLGHQVTETYDFSRAITVALKEFAPDHVILLGPGAGLGGAVAQTMIAENWLGLRDKADFVTRQETPTPYVLSMGIPEQRRLVVASDA
ncbi:malonyl CoA-ACP transacylase [Pseudidiomarina taiwanensis]|uniref:[acyl-carrier-protein] S-malonyltransferase n=1 Tax=Pseudidiomarina taiwanensis TaxID=337250 RepID=A0A432ZFD0_9GAMM|nr:malonyl CoA-ACP transacylase [Pseudidiomarina taiwanensis]RUO76643.1 malonyl CoA-ACP transacylase [Pseudidiomarina taiwanensis]